MENTSDSANTPTSRFALVEIAKDPQSRPLFIYLAVMLLVGMVFYHFVEHWSWLDSLYFCVVSLATVGYGDLVPTEPISKIFTIIYLINGLALFVSFVQILAQQRTRLRKAKPEAASEDFSAN